MDAVFKTSLSDEEIEKNFQNIDFFSGIMAGLEEAMAYEKGEAKAATFARKAALPNVDVVVIRTGLHMTQNAFANVLGVSKRTVEAWEAGKSTPSPTAKKLLHLIQQDHTLIEKL